MPPWAVTSTRLNVPEKSPQDCCVTDNVPVRVARIGVCSTAEYRQFPTTLASDLHPSVIGAHAAKGSKRKHAPITLLIARLIGELEAIVMLHQQL